jgi:hypothetical protein
LSTVKDIDNNDAAIKDFMKRREVAEETKAEAQLELQEA